MMRRTTVLICALAVVSLVACGKKNAVGSGVDTNKLAAGSGCRVGECTTTTAAAAPTTTTAAVVATTVKATTTTMKATTTTTQPAGIAVGITANGFEPSNVRVYVGQPVKYTNKDTQTRSVQANDGSFGSGDLAPGASWTFSTARPGKYDISDGTRPFVIGSIEVLAR